MRTPEPRMDLQDWFLLFILSVLWGGSFLFGRIAVLEIPPMTLVLARVGLAALTLSIVMMFVSGKRVQIGISGWLAFGGMGLLNNVIPFGLIFYGQQEIGAGLAAIVNAMTPIWTVVIAHFLTADEKMRIHKLIGIALGILGVSVLVGGDAFSGNLANVWAQIAVLGATLSYGFASVFGKRFTGLPPMQTAHGQLTMSTLIMLPIALYADRFWRLPFPSSEVAWSIIALAVFSTALAYILFFRILSRAGATNISIVTLLVPLSAIALGAIILGETLTLRHYFGMITILMGLVLIDGRIFRKS